MNRVHSLKGGPIRIMVLAKWFATLPRDICGVCTRRSLTDLLQVPARIGRAASFNHPAPTRHVHVCMAAGR